MLDDAVNPQFVVFFAGRTARDKPWADLLAALSGVTLLRADTRGAVEADGMRKSEKKQAAR